MRPHRRRVRRNPAAALDVLGVQHVAARRDRRAHRQHGAAHGERQRHLGRCAVTGRRAQCKAAGDLYASSPRRVVVTPIGVSLTEAMFDFASDRGID
jgi:hypothetical protein